MTARYRIGFDIGGTFTDFILLDSERSEIRLHKCLTTPADPSVGALEGTDTTRVLVVDADRNASETVRTVLNDLGGYVVETASDALSAAVACGASSPDVIVFDVGAGDPKAFISALRTRPNFARTCFVAVGTHFNDDGLALVRAGFAATLRKPYSVRMLLDTLASARRTGTRRAG